MSDSPTLSSMSRAGLIALISALALGLPAAASAQDGVFVDPDSPSGKEYQIPLESVRRQANPHARPGAKIAPGERSSPLFGEGIGSGETRGGATRTRSDEGGEPRGPANAERSGSAARRSEAERAAREAITAATTRPGAPAGGAGSTLAVVGGAIVVLLAGGLGGYVLRRRGAAS